LQLYKELQGKIEITSDQLTKGANDAEKGAKNKATKEQRAMLLMCGLSLLILLVIASRITTSINRGLGSFSAQFTRMAEANDLTARVDENRVDEIGDLGKCLNLFVHKVHSILGQIAQATQSVTSASEQLSNISQQITANSAETSAQSDVVSKAAHAVSQNLQTVASGAEEMGASIKEIAKNATEAAKGCNICGEGCGNDHRYGRQVGRIVNRNWSSNQSHYFNCAADEPAGAERDH
jgi:methyl-accepting chemotaxis protein